MRRFQCICSAKRHIEAFLTLNKWNKIDCSVIQHHEKHLDGLRSVASLKFSSQLFSICNLYACMPINRQRGHREFKLMSQTQPTHCNEAHIDCRAKAGTLTWDWKSQIHCSKSEKSYELLAKSLESCTNQLGVMSKVFRSIIKTVNQIPRLVVGSSAFKNISLARSVHPSVHFAMRNIHTEIPFDRPSMPNAGYIRILMPSRSSFNRNRYMLFHVIWCSSMQMAS